MALLRAVGIVLRNVDSKTSDALRKAIDEKWKQPKPPIFKEFIERDRSAVLKRYEHPETTFDKIMGTLYPRLIRQYEGQQGVSINYLVDEAIKYWEEYLDDVERLADVYENKSSS